MRIFIIIAFALATVIGLTYLARAHSFHHNALMQGTAPSVPQNDAERDGQSEKTKRKDKDAFYGNAKNPAEKDAINRAHQARLASKSNDRFSADIRLAAQDIINRLFGQ